jgi:hypothetical protein
MTEPKRAHEASDLSVRSLARILGALLVFALLAVAGTYEMVRLLRASTRNNQPQATAIEAAPLVTPKPRLQTAPRTDLAEIRSHEGAQLNSYGWVDRGQGVAHIPIGRAMALTAGKSLDAPP